MDVRSLLETLTLLESTLTLQAVQSAERSAAEEAEKVKASGNTWEKFTGWDPKTAGNIALAKLAAGHGLSGLFNNQGEFVIAYGDKSWSSTPGNSPRIAPPTPDDWNPLAKLGLIPPNAKGPAGLTNALTGGGAQQEFDTARQSQPVTDLALDDNEEQVNDEPKDEREEVAELDQLVNKYLAQVRADEVTPTNENYLDDSIAEQLVESFGYMLEQSTSQGGISWGDDDGKYTWDDPIITLPDGTVIYAFRDLAFDLGISIAAIGLGTIFAVPTGGASEVTAAAIVAPKFIKIAKLVQMWWKAFKAPMTVFKDAAAAKSAISTFAKSHLSAFKAAVVRSIKGAPNLVLWTAGANWLMSWLGEVLSDDAKIKIMQAVRGASKAIEKIPGAYAVKKGASDFGDWVGKTVGINDEK